MSPFQSLFSVSALLDIAILSLLIYQVLSFLHGTRALAILIGLGALIGLYLLSQYFDLLATQWLIGILFGNLFLVAIVLFQDDIRRALARMGRTPFLRGISVVAQSQVIEEVTRAAGALAARKIGCLIAIERRIGLNDYIEIGTALDARVDRDLLFSIFLPHSPLHDGAAIIQVGRISSAGCVLPLNVDPTISKQLGTRHRAALGLTAETDAAVVVVSEETGTISLSIEGRLTRDLDSATLRNHLLELMKAS
ncbi:MAG: diadenylate cyclase CdaA [Bdellovibrionota bacterium]